MSFRIVFLSLVAIFLPVTSLQAQKPGEFNYEKLSELLNKASKSDFRFARTEERDELRKQALELTKKLEKLPENTLKSFLDKAVESQLYTVAAVLFDRVNLKQDRKATQELFNRIAMTRVWGYRFPEEEKEGGEFLSKLTELGVDLNPLVKSSRLLNIVSDNPKVFHLLLEKGANPNLRNGEKGENAIETVLRYQAFNKSLEKDVKLLMDHGMDPNGKDLDGESYLSLVARGHSPETVKALLDRKANPTTVSLHSISDPETALLLIRNGVDLKERDKKGNSVLHYFSAPYFDSKKKNGDLVVDELIKMGADVNATNDKGQTPLHAALNTPTGGYYDVLLSKGAAVDRKDLEGNTPLHIAALRGRPEAVRLLLKTKGTEPYAINKVGKSPLNLALESLRERSGRATDDAYLHRDTESVELLGALRTFRELSSREKAQSALDALKAIGSVKTDGDCILRSLERLRNGRFNTLATKDWYSARIEFLEQLRSRLILSLQIYSEGNQVPDAFKRDVRQAIENLGLGMRPRYSEDVQVAKGAHALPEARGSARARRAVDLR